MNNGELKDPGGRLLGKTKILSSGKIEGRDAGGRLKGTYDPKKNETKDAGGRLIGKGDLLSSLIIGR